jgi:hypothetical protein
MKPSTKANILFLIGSAGIWVSVFSKPLGIPSGLDAIPSLLSIIFFYLGYRLSKAAKTAGQIPAATDSQKQKRFWIFVTAYGAASVATPFLLPFTGVRLPLGTLVVISIIAFFCVLALLG